MPCDYCIPVVDFQLPFSIDIPQRNEFAIADIGDNTIRCFTDGSRMGNRSGAGAYIINSEGESIQISQPLGMYTTVFQAEITAIDIAARALCESTRKNIEFYVDNQAAIKAVSKPTKSSKAVIDCKASLDALCHSNVVSVHWIPAHSDYDGNELADRLAKAATELVCTGPEPMVPISIATCKMEISNWADAEHNKSWALRNDCRQTRSVIMEVSQARTDALMSLTRQQLRQTIQVLTGHANLARHRFIMGKVASPICPKCELEDETPEHFVGNCPVWSEKRSQLLGARVGKLPDFAHPREIKGLARFLVATKHLMDFGHPPE